MVPSRPEPSYLCGAFPRGPGPRRLCHHQGRYGVGSRRLPIVTFFAINYELDSRFPCGSGHAVVQRHQASSLLGPETMRQVLVPDLVRSPEGQRGGTSP
jgi:hypothetical protein